MLYTKDEHHENIFPRSHQAADPVAPCRAAVVAAGLHRLGTPSTRRAAAHLPSKPGRGGRPWWGALGTWRPTLQTQSFP